MPLVFFRNLIVSQNLKISRKRSNESFLFIKSKNRLQLRAGVGVCENVSTPTPVKTTDSDPAVLAELAPDEQKLASELGECNILNRSTPVNWERGF